MAFPDVTQLHHFTASVLASIHAAPHVTANDADSRKMHSQIWTT
jgi:hypothetical protein